ncbi:MAG: hypothetical protein US25_C0054G0002 [Candidatus Moranbacteria bacterium GW2011_GWE1_36_7]|nr:MAG: hypothetical protein UR99_C0061G0002 [Candidatus Moranbacteria bacterium GW2011_GWD2_36_12]KKQ12295.1 MAG: hypothetical protein US25_C0054G0002 [Candidatus Moranbacteria bacterium GW2011_GWE1_36_7]
MIIDGQKAQIRVEVNGCTVLYSGSTYPPDKVTFSNRAIDVIMNKLSREKYNDVIVSGCLESANDELTIVEINLC